MKTKEEAEAKLALLPLLRPVDVADVIDEETGPRRSFQFDNADKSQTIVTIDADPSPRQVADLASNLPLPEDQRMAALAVMAAVEVSPTGSTSMLAMGTSAGVGAAVATAAAIAAHLLGFL